MKEKLLQHPILFPATLNTAFCMQYVLLLIATPYFGFSGRELLQSIPGFIYAGSLLGLLVFYPLTLTFLNLYFLFEKQKTAISIKAGAKIEIITLILGVIYAGLYAIFNDVRYVDWNEQLINKQMHTPIATITVPTLIAWALVAFCGYLVLRFVPLRKLPPLCTVCALGCMYLGDVLAMLLLIQVFGTRLMPVCLLPLNYFIITAKVIRELIVQWNAENLEEASQTRYAGRHPLDLCNRLLRNATYWPLAAFLIMWPILGILTGALVLFGQAPDGIIKAFTETSDWNLSQRVAPQNLYIDEHYLCTVAAGGHATVVKPLRRGERHGHEVIVNRQLCIANAFEQILEEKTPRFHAKVRHFYDSYGYPIAKHIQSPFAADAIYFVMKPLEWLFLLVLYFCDAKPENRIAVQYLPKDARAALQQQL